MARIKNLLDRIFTATNSVTAPIKVTPTTVPTPVNSYNRKQRRQGSFVIHNKTSDLYVRSFQKKDGTIVFKDVPIDKASIYVFDSVEWVMSHILLNEPNLDIQYRMVLKSGNELKVV